MSDLSLLARLTDALADRYRVERPIGAGGMASVFLAEDLRHRRLVAIKVLDPELAEAVGSDRFLREIEIAANLSHPHILPVFDSGDVGRLLFFVMPYVEGEYRCERGNADARQPRAGLRRGRGGRPERPIEYGTAIMPFWGFEPFESLIRPEG